MYQGTTSHCTLGIDTMDIDSIHSTEEKISFIAGHIYQSRATNNIYFCTTLGFFNIKNGEYGECVPSTIAAYHELAAKLKDVTDEYVLISRKTGEKFLKV